MPLARGPDGRLGVRAGARRRSVNVTVNITTPRCRKLPPVARAQIAATLARAVERGQRNL